MLAFIGIVIYGFLAVLCWNVATKRGRNGFGWFFLALFITPIAVLILLLLLGPTETKRTEQIVEEGTLRKAVREGNTEYLTKRQKKHQQQAEKEITGFFPPIFYVFLFFVIVGAFMVLGR